jgi:CIC family chloride channel protein
VMFVALIGKIAASGFTLGSGAPGGSFFPPVFMGAMLGGTLGTLGHSLLPSLISGPGPYAAVGMAAVVAGATQAPLTAILMLFELTGSYEIILPLMLACTTSVAGAHWWLGGSIYTLKLRSKGIRLKSSGQDPLHQLLVQDVMTRDPVTVRASDTVQEVLRIARERKHSAFPMLNASGQFCGMLRLEHLSSSLADGDRSKPATAEDCALAHPPVAFPGETLEVARQRMQAERTSHLPVIDPSRPGVLLGIISQRDLLNSFDLEAGSRVAVSDGLRAG